MTTAETGLRRTFAPLIASRVLMVAAVLGLVWFGGAWVGQSTGTIFHSTFAHWDALAYLRIANRGYPPHLNPDDAFLPGYPVLVALAGRVTGDDVLGGVLVSLIAEAVALYYIYRLVQNERDRADATFGIWLMALAPFAFFLGAVYTESMFIAAAAASLHHARQGNLGRAGLAAMVACATRITGVALVPALAIEYWRRRGLSWHRDLVAIGAAGLPLAGYALYMAGRVGDPLALVHANEVGFGHTLATPWDGFAATWATVVNATGENRFIFLREVVFGVAGVLICAAAWVVPRFPRSLAAYCSVVMLMAVSLSFWRSVPRYELALFPLILLVADVTRRRTEIRVALVTVSGALMVWGTTIFAQGRWLA